MNFRILVIALLSVFVSSQILAQQDTLIANDNTILTGEIKDMDLGVISIETSFSDEDFKIEWLKVKQIISKESFRFTTTEGMRYFGTVEEDTAENILIINDIEVGKVTVKPESIVYIKQVDQGSILDVINLAFDVGYSFTKSNNLHQLNGSLTADYITNVWGLNIYSSTVRNVQDDAEDVRRDNAGIGLKLFFANDFFGNVASDYFSSNEQQLTLRSNYNASLGRYFVHTNKIYFNSSLGAGYTVENYSDTTETRKSAEGVIKLEYNMFDMGDLNLLTNLSVFPSFTESGRWRSSFNFQLKYDLPRDFYIKTSLDYNYDNQPIEGVNAHDYVITGGVGWEL